MIQYFDKCYGYISPQQYEPVLYRNVNIHNMKLEHLFFRNLDNCVTWNEF